MKDFNYMLAPMEGITESCYRTICEGADMTFTEMARFEALSRSNKSMMRKIALYDSTPTEIQIIGRNESNLQKFLNHFVPSPGFKGFNLNLGCPSPEYTSIGLGCAMIKRVSKVRRIVQMVKTAGFSCSVKLRLGMNQYEKDRGVYLNLINGVEADYFIVHAKHGQEKSLEEVDWSVYRNCCETGKRIVANGNIRTKEDVKKVEFCYGVMIGREAIRDPTIFCKLKEIQCPSKNELMQRYDKLLLERHVAPEYRDNVKNWQSKE